MDIEFIANKTALFADLTASSRVTKSFSSSLLVSISVHEKKVLSGHRSSLIEIIISLSSLFPEGNSIRGPGKQCEDPSGLKQDRKYHLTFSISMKKNKYIETVEVF